MVTLLGQDQVNEMWLWHGTSASSLKSLLLNGFERNFGNRQGYLFRRHGVYFAGIRAIRFTTRSLSLRRILLREEMKK